MTLADASTRELALTPNRSFAVSAPAGSGKTELLTQRVLKLLAVVGEPEEILCMTFTRKAAGEMQHRILQALTQANNKTEGNLPQDKTNSHQQLTHDLAQNVLTRDKEKHWQLLDNPNRLRIQTIDSFCLNLAQQLAIESRFGDYSEPLDDPTPIYREAITALLLPALEQQSPLGLAISTLLQHLDNDLNKLEQLLINLLSKREQWLGQLYQSRGARDYLEDFLNQVIEETLSNAGELLVSAGSDLALLADYAANQLPATKQNSPIRSCLGITSLPAAKATELPQWEGLCELLMTAKDEWRKRLDKNGGFPTETLDGDKDQAKAQKETMTVVIAELQTMPGLLDALTDIRYLPTNKYDDDQWQVLDALTLLLPALSAALSLSFQQKKVCDFTEITLAALLALGSEEEPTDLALKLDYKISHILTDEFQDTSSVQFDLLRRLTAGWQTNDGRSLFIVGDAMQSLYGFRNANVGLFLEARSLPLGNIQLEPLDLQVNFRSQAAIIDWVNSTFTQVFPPCDNISRGAVSYSPAIPHHPALPTEAVTVDAFIDYPDLKTEAEHVTELVEQARKDDPEGSIAILVRNRTHLTDILEALREKGCRWQATDIDPLGKRMPVIDLMSLTRALLSPADRIAWLSILRAPWCGLDLKDLFQLANYKLKEEDQQPKTDRYPLLLLNIFNHQQILGISDSGQQILSRVSHQLKQAWDQRYRKPLRSWIEGVWISVGGAAALHSDTELNQCWQYLDLLEQHESCGTLEDWPSFEKAVQSLYAKPDLLADPNLHVMTIHKAKGLEFDTVIIPGLNRKPRSDDKQLMLWLERVGQYGQNQLIIGPLERTGQETDPLFRYLQREQKIKGQLEKARVLYVGCTRAIKKLHLTYSIGKDKKPTANSLLESLWPVLSSTHVAETDNSKNSIQSQIFQSHYYQESDSELEKNGGKEGHLEKNVPSLNHIYRLPSHWQFNQHSNKPDDLVANNEWTINEGTTGQNEQRKPLQENLSELNTVSRHTGTVLHRVLQQIVLEGIDYWTETTISNRQPFWKIQLQQLGVTELEKPLALIHRAVKNCLEDETANWLLSNSHQDGHCEYKIGYIGANGQPKTAVVDRCFISEGTQWVIDYKTAEPLTGESQESFIQRETTLYREQLEHYAKLFEQIGNYPVKTALYFPLISHLAVI